MPVGQSRSKFGTNHFEIGKCEMILDFGLFVVIFFVLGLVSRAGGGVTHGPGKVKTSVTCKEPDDKNLLPSESMTN